MTPEAILDHQPRVLSQAQREQYFEKGFLAAEGLIPDEWLALLRARSAEFIDKSRHSGVKRGIRYRPGTPARPSACAAAARTGRPASGFLADLQ